MHGFYFSRFPEFCSQAFTGRLHGILKQWLSHCPTNLTAPRRGCRYCHGDGHSGEALCSGSGLFRADLLSTILIYLTFCTHTHTQIHLKKGSFANHQKKNHCAKEIFVAACFLGQESGASWTLPSHHPGTGCTVIGQHFLSSEKQPLEVQTVPHPMEPGLRQGRGQRATVLGPGDPWLFDRAAL